MALNFHCSSSNWRFDLISSFVIIAIVVILVVVVEVEVVNNYYDTMTISFEYPLEIISEVNLLLVGDAFAHASLKEENLLLYKSHQLKKIEIFLMK